MSSKLSPFDYLNAINSSKKDLMADEENESGYVPYVVNRSLSYFADTVLYANEMNMLHDLSKKPQFHYYLHSLRARKRFAKWHKVDVNADVDLIQQAYGCSRTLAEQYLELLSAADLAAIRDRLNTGGKE